MVILTYMNRNNIYTLCNEDNINLLNNYINFILCRYNYYYYSEYKKFKDYYIRYLYYKNQLKNIIYYNYSGEFHREDESAFITYDDNGGIYKKEYYLNGKKYSYEDYVLEIKKLV